MTIIDLEFDTTATGGAPLGDIAASLVSIDELLRDLASLAASTVEFREIQVASITTRSPLKVTLNLLAIPEEAVTAFQEICRAIIVFRDDRSRQSAIDAVLARCAVFGEHGLSEQQSRRISAHIATLQKAEVRLKAVVAKIDGQS